MIKVHLQINELGPLSNVRIDLAQFMVFTGASSLGKSYTNFLCYYVYALFANNRLDGFLSPKIVGKDLTNNITISFKVSELKEWLRKDVKTFFVELLSYNDINCDVDFVFDGFEDSQKLSFDIAKVELSSVDSPVIFHVVIHNESRLLAASIGELNVQSITRTISNHLCIDFLGKLYIRSFLLPPGRSSLIDNTFSLQQSVAARVGMYNTFLRDLDLICHTKFDLSDGDNKDNLFFKSRIQKLVNGSLIQDKDGIKILLPNGRIMPLSGAASSIRELSPILFWIQNQQIKNQSICIEEPEAHSHPQMQYDIAELLSACINKGASIQITTHSNYLLARLNELIRLYNLSTDNPKYFEKIKVKHRISPRTLLNPSLISAYYFSGNKDGSVSVEKMDVSDGIPFKSFAGVTKLQINVDEYINKGYEEEE